MKHRCLSNVPDEFEAEGEFEIRPEWSGYTEDDDNWEVARPTTDTGVASGIHPGAIAVCGCKEHALAVQDALNTYVNGNARSVTKHFNGLREDEAERLAMLAEECGEVIQVVGKILRHGYESQNPDDPGDTNRDLLTKKLSDLVAVMEMMDADFARIDATEQERVFANKMRWTHHQK